MQGGKKDGNAKKTGNILQTLTVGERAVGESGREGENMETFHKPEDRG